jgi:hypothetical protein
MSGSWLRVAAYDIVWYASFGVDAVALNARAISQQYNERRHVFSTNFRRHGGNYAKHAPTFVVLLADCKRI